ncbi:MAG TPA: NRDE family protein [Thermoanaerobaculia bacterium]|nr:NRDE family protein [Thermoanaerobaculia bacterium]
MCLIVLAHRASERFPLIIAANRDEDYERPSLPAHFWEGDEIAGGRDALQGGSWLAVTRSGRFAAVTNLRGAVRAPESRSRGELVTEFVRAGATPAEYTAAVAARQADYAGFHLLVGEVGGELALLSGSALPLEPGIHGLSNAPLGVRWPKVDLAAESVRGALQSAAKEEVANHLLRLLRNAPTHADPTRDLFIHGERYGTRASTVIVAGGNEVLFAEQNYGPRGVPAGGRNELRFPLFGRR